MRHKFSPPLMAVAVLAVLCAHAAAQWVNYVPPGVPRNPDGKPNLAAPAPRTADGKPDLSGVWRTIASKYTLNVVADLKASEIQPWAAAASKRTLENFNKDDPHAP